MTDRTNTDARQSSPSAQRNREAILAVLKNVLPEAGAVLEIACGSGEHAVFFASHFPALPWQPSDPDPASRASCAAWTAELGLSNVLPPIAIDAAASEWGPVERIEFKAILCINMIHIAPWEAALGLFAGAGRILPSNGVLFLYGPFMRGGVHTAPSNKMFDQSLRAQDPSWGVRDLDDVAEAATREKLLIAEVLDMPSNNFSVVLRKE